MLLHYTLYTPHASLISTSVLSCAAVISQGFSNPQFRLRLLLHSRLCTKFAFFLVLSEYITVFFVPIHIFNSKYPTIHCEK